jgi:transposase
MMLGMGIIAASLKLRRGDRNRLEGLVRRGTTEHRKVQRAQIVLLANAGESNTAIAQRTGAHRNQVIEWRRRYEEMGMGGLEDRERSGRPKTISAREIRKVVNTVCCKPPRGLSRWSVRTLANEVNISQSSVQRILRENHLHPHRLRTFNFSPDPKFEGKLLEVVGLYLSPPKNALVLCVDEKTGIQALDRTQPMLPLKSKKPRSWTNEYVRHGTQTLLASLDIATGEVTAWVNKTRKSKDFISFMNKVVEVYPKQRLCVVLDNLNTHKGKLAEQWLEKHPLVSFHYTPTHASWVNLIECFFSILTRQGLQQAVHKSVGQLRRFLYAYIEKYNSRCGPFEWTKGPEKLKRIIKLTQQFQQEYLH